MQIIPPSSQPTVLYSLQPGLQVNALILSQTFYEIFHIIKSRDLMIKVEKDFIFQKIKMENKQRDCRENGWDI